MASVRPRTPGRWEARWYVQRPDGTLQRRSRHIDARTEADAMRQAFALEEADRAAGGGAQRGLTVNDALDRHLDTARMRLAPRSLRALEDSMRIHVRPAVGKVQLAKLTPAHLERMMSDMHRDGRSAQTILHALYAVSGALKQAQRSGLVARNVAELVQKPKLRRREVRTADPQAVFQLLAWCDAQVGSQAVLEVSVAVRLSAVTGARLGEVVALRWGDLDRPSGTVRIRRAATDYASPHERGARVVEVKETKTGAGSTLALPEQMVERLDELFAARQLVSPWLFPGAGGELPISPTAMNGRFVRAVKASGATPFGFHALRHLFATSSIQAGIPVPVVAALLRHARPSTTSDIYWHVEHSAGVDRRAVDEVTRVLGPGL